MKHFFGRYLTAGFVQDDKEQHPGSLRQVRPAGRNSADRLGTEEIVHFIKLREEHQRVQKIDRRDNHTAKDKVSVWAVAGSSTQAFAVVVNKGVGEEADADTYQADKALVSAGCATVANAIVKKTSGALGYTTSAAFITGSSGAKAALAEVTNTDGILDPSDGTITLTGNKNKTATFTITVSCGTARSQVATFSVTTNNPASGADATAYTVTMISDKWTAA